MKNMTEVFLERLIHFKKILQSKNYTSSELLICDINDLQFCRFCLEDGRSSNFFDIRKTPLMWADGKVEKISDMLEKLIGFLTPQDGCDDGFPSKVCLDCFKKISQLYHFQSQVERANEIVVELYKKLNELDSNMCSNKFNGNSEKSCNHLPVAIANRNLCDGIEIPNANIIGSINENNEINTKISSSMHISDVQTKGNDALQEELLAADNHTEIIVEDNGDNILISTCDISDLNFTESKELPYNGLAEGGNGIFKKDQEILVNNTETNYVYYNDCQAVSEGNPNSDYGELITSPEYLELNEILGVDAHVNENSDVIVNNAEIKNSRKPKKLRECGICGIKFPTQASLTRHLVLEHPSERAFTCQECGAEFVHFQSLYRHSRSHRPAIVEEHCVYCNAVFRRADDMKRHIRIHTGERPYKCHLCDKAFKQVSELLDHKIIHQDRNNFFKCEICGKGLKTRCGIYLHMKSHNAKQYKDKVMSVNDAESSGSRKMPTKS